MKIAPSHSIASSATASRDGGTARSSTLAVVKLMTRSNLVGCSTEMAAGFVSAQNLVHNLGGALPSVQPVRSIGHQTFRFDVLSGIINRRQPRALEGANESAVSLIVADQRTPRTEALIGWPVLRWRRTQPMR
jgi:hypothetical protein